MRLRGATGPKVELSRGQKNRIAFKRFRKPIRTIARGPKPAPSGMLFVPTARIDPTKIIDRRNAPKPPRLPTILQQAMNRFSSSRQRTK